MPDPLVGRYIDHDDRICPVYEPEHDIAIRIYPSIGPSGCSCSR